MALLKKADPDALSVVVAFLQEAAADSDLINKSTSYGEIEIGANLVSVKPWIKARNAGDNLFRYRILDTPATVYRIVYGYDWHTRRIGILAVVHRDKFKYAISGELADRIQNDWDSATDGRGT